VKAAHLESELVAVTKARVGSCDVTAPSNLEDQVDRLRAQVEDMVRAMQQSAIFPGRELLPAAGALSENSSEHAGSCVDLATPRSRPLSPSALQLLDIDAQKHALRWQQAMYIGTGCSTAIEEELPTTEERLMGEWSCTTLQTSDPPRARSTQDVEEESREQEEEQDEKEEEEEEEEAEGGQEDKEDLLSPAPIYNATAIGGTGGDIGCDGSQRSMSLSLRDLSEIKALKKPPPPIRMLMEVCCMLFNIQPVKLVDEKSTQGRLRLDYWEPARRYLLSDPFFLHKLRTYDDQLSLVQRSKIRRHFKDAEFTAERIRNCSKAAHELYVWVEKLIQVQRQQVHGRGAPSVASPGQCSAGQAA